MAEESEERCIGSALWIIDMVSTWEFPGAEKLLRAAVRIAPRVARLKARHVDLGLPVVYVNDNHGRWQSDFPAQVAASLEAGAQAAAITEALMPTATDYFVLKPHWSAFYQTPAELLQARLQAERIVLAGVASDQCILSTALDAHMRGLKVWIPRDCVAAQSSGRHIAMLRYFHGVLGVDTREGESLPLEEWSRSPTRGE